MMPQIAYAYLFPESCFNAKLVINRINNSSFPSVSYSSTRRSNRKAISFLLELVLEHRLGLDDKINDTFRALFIKTPSTLFSFGLKRPVKHSRTYQWSFDSFSKEQRSTWLWPEWFQERSEAPLVHSQTEHLPEILSLGPPRTPYRPTTSSTWDCKTEGGLLSLSMTLLQSNFATYAQLTI